MISKAGKISFIILSFIAVSSIFGEYYLIKTYPINEFEPNSVYFIGKIESNLSMILNFDVIANNSYHFYLFVFNPHYADYYPMLSIEDKTDNWYTFLNFRIGGFEGYGDYYCLTDDILFLTINITKGMSWTLTIAQNLPVTMKTYTFYGNLQFSLLVYLVFYLVLIQCNRDKFINYHGKKVNLLIREDNRVLIHNPINPNQNIDECISCKKHWDPAFLVHFIKRNYQWTYRAGPYCPECWSQLKYDFAPKFVISKTIILLLIGINASIIAFVSFYVSPSFGAVVGSILVSILIFLPLIFVMPFPSTQEDTVLRYHSPEIVQAMSNERRIQNIPIYCSHHPHMRVIGSCPYCGEFYCTLCISFFSLRSSASAQKSLDIVEKLDQIEDPIIQGGAIMVTSLSTHVILPELNMNDPQVMRAYLNSLEKIPSKFHELYTPGIYYLVEKLCNNEIPIAMNYSPFLLHCLNHADGRKEIAYRKEKSSRNLLFITGIMISALVISGLFHANLAFYFLSIIFFVGLFIIYYGFRQSPMMLKPINVSEKEYADYIDSFLVFLDDFITSRTKLNGKNT